MWLLFFSVLISSLIIGAFGISLTSNVIKNSSTENMRLLCKNNADKIDITFAKIEESVNTLAHYVESELPNVDMLKDTSFRNSFSAEVKKNALHHIENTVGAAAIYLHYDPSFIEGTDGFYYVKYKESDKFTYHPLVEISEYAETDNGNVGWWYIPTISGKATWFEAYYEAKLDRYIISYVVPVYKNDTLVGVIGADIFTEHVVNLAKEVSIFNSGQAAVLKSDGTVLYHPNFERGKLIGEGDPGFEGVIDKLTKETSTKELIPYELDGVKKQLASCKLKNGMLMICFAPISEIYSEQTKLTIANISITCVVVLVALFVAFLVSVKLARPIRRLNEAAKRLTDGEFDFDIKNETYDEIGELTNTFIETRKILRQQIHLLHKEAHVDGLTGVGNKAAFIDREHVLNEEISQDKADFSVAVFDVNKLKIANDIFGHMAGDKLLQTVANHLAAFFDTTDIYRLGGDEFVVIIPEEENTNNSQKVLSCMESMKTISVEGYPDCMVSCAYGFSRFDKIKDSHLSDVLRRADKKMYKNKAETKKETFPWQQGAKGIKQLQIDKYCELLKSLKASTDDYLYLMNIETGFLCFFGEEDRFFNVATMDERYNGILDLLKYVHTNDHLLLKNAIASVLNRDSETIDLNFRMMSNNSMRWVNCRGNVIKDETDSHFVLIGRISQNAIKFLYNPITTLFNKAKLKIDLQTKEMSNFSSLMLIDIDNLSGINLKHGSEYGDSLLKTLAEELENRFPLKQIYHAEKDRFVLLLNASSSLDVESIFAELKDAMATKCTISASVVPNDAYLYISADNIYDYAVQVLNTAKKDDVGKVVFFSKESLLEKISEVELLEELEESVNNKFEGFYLVYQPQISEEDYSIISAETLLRYKSKSKGQIFPDQFIPILERTGLINEVGLWVTREALKQCKEWRKYNPDFKISVNISPKQLQKEETTPQIINMLSDINLPGDALILEITESAQLDESGNVFLSIAKFRQAGIQIAIDDFGTGYSNLGNLKHIHANILKVDRVFIRDIKENGYNYNLIYNVLEFAKSNSLKVCLEGVETKEELFVLSSLRPDFFQGYLFDRPCSAEILEDKYFKVDSEAYINRLNYIQQLNKEKRNGPSSVNLEIKTILSGLNIGLWIVRVDSKTGEKELYADEIMKDLLGVDKNITPKECFAHLYDNIPEEYRSVIDSMISEMASCEKVVQAEFPWHHPQKNKIQVRYTGRCSNKNDALMVFEGFFRTV